MRSDRPLANVKVDAELLRKARLRAAQRSVKEGRAVTLQEIFAEALQEYLKKATPK